MGDICRTSALTRVRAARQLVSHASVPQQRVSHCVVFRAVPVQRGCSFREAACQQEAGCTGRIAGLAEGPGTAGQVLEQQQLLAVSTGAGSTSSQLRGLSRCAGTHFLSAQVTANGSLSLRECDVIGARAGWLPLQRPDNDAVIVAEQRLPVLLATASTQAASLLAASPSAARAAVTAPNMSTHTCTGNEAMLTASRASFWGRPSTARVPAIDSEYSAKLSG